MRSLTVACGEGAIRILELQRAGAKPMTADVFLRGTRLPAGSRHAMNIRPEKPGDEAAIGEVVTAAFGRRQEADLVQAAAREGDLVLSLVVEDDGAIVGHVAFSRVWIERDGARVAGHRPRAGLGAARAQRKGTARALIGAGHLRLKTLGEKIVFVLGDPDYYKRFGFSHETAKAFACIYQGEHLQALRLSPDAPAEGEVIYAAAFAGLD